MTALVTMCTCGHDYGTHDSSKRNAPCVGRTDEPRKSRRCSCRMFTDKDKLAADAREAARCVASDLGIAIAPTRAPAEPLVRIAVALERIADLLADERAQRQADDDGPEPEVCAGCGAPKSERALHWKVRGAWVCIVCHDKEKARVQQ
jgi:hypothetical protein